MYLYYLLWHTLFLISVAPNLLLLYLNIRKASQIIGRPYNILLIDVTISDLVISFGTWLSMPCSLPADQSKPTVYFGICRYISPEFCFHSNRIAMHVVFNNVCIVLASFIIRRRILIQNKVTYAQVTVAAVIAYIPALTTLLLQYGIPRTTSYISGADSFISEFQLPFEEEYAVLILHLGSWEGIAAAVVSPILVIFTALASILLRWNLSKIIRTGTPGTMSPATKTIHMALVKTLSLQACIPLLTFVTTFFYILFGYIRGLSQELLQSPFLNSLSFFITFLIPFLNSCTALCYIPTYRSSLLKMFHFYEDSSLAPVASRQQRETIL